MGDGEWLTLRQAAELAGKSYTTLYAQVRLGNLPAETRGDHRLRKSGGGPVIVIRRSDLQVYLDRIAERAARGPLTNTERQRRKYQRKQGKSPSVTY